MRFFHSLWTKPIINKQFGRAEQAALNINLLYSLISALHIKRLGHEIVLHTDKLGEELLSEIVPYDDIYRTLDKHTAHHRFWASGKIKALQTEPLGSIHIDTDVFVSTNKLMDMLKDDKTDLLIEAVEDDDPMHFYTMFYKTVISKVNSFPYIRMDSFCANMGMRCGLHKFNNKRLKDEYTSGYWRIHDDYVSANCERLQGDTNYTPDLILEQSYLYNLVEQKKYSYKAIAPYAEHKPTEGFHHFLGKSKFELKNHFEEKLQKESPKIYNKYITKVKEVNKQYE